MKHPTVTLIFILVLLSPCASFSYEPLPPLQRKMTVLIPAGNDPDVVGFGSEGESINYFAFHANFANLYDISYEANIVTNKNGEINDTKGRLSNLIEALKATNGGLVSWGMHAFDLNLLTVEYWTMVGSQEDNPTPCENIAIDRANDYYDNGVGEFTFPDGSFGFRSMYDNEGHKWRCYLLLNKNWFVENAQKFPRIRWLHVVRCLSFVDGFANFLGAVFGATVVTSYHGVVTPFKALASTSQLLGAMSALYDTVVPTIVKGSYARPSDLGNRNLPIVAKNSRFE